MKPKMFQKKSVENVMLWIILLGSIALTLIGTAVFHMGHATTRAGFNACMARSEKFQVS